MHTHILSANPSFFLYGGERTYVNNSELPLKQLTFHKQTPKFKILHWRVTPAQAMVKHFTSGGSSALPDPAQSATSLKQSLLTPYGKELLKPPPGAITLNSILKDDASPTKVVEKFMAATAPITFKANDPAYKEIKELQELITLHGSLTFQRNTENINQVSILKQNKQIILKGLDISTKSNDPLGKKIAKYLPQQRPDRLNTLAVYEAVRESVSNQGSPAVCFYAKGEADTACASLLADAPITVMTGSYRWGTPTDVEISLPHFRSTDMLLGSSPKGNFDEDTSWESEHAKKLGLSEGRLGPLSVHRAIASESLKNKKVIGISYSPFTLGKDKLNFLPYDGKKEVYRRSAEGHANMAFWLHIDKGNVTIQPNDAEFSKDERFQNWSKNGPVTFKRDPKNNDRALVLDPAEKSSELNNLDLSKKSDNYLEKLVTERLQEYKGYFYVQHKIFNDNQRASHDFKAWVHNSPTAREKEETFIRNAQDFLQNISHAGGVVMIHKALPKELSDPNLPDTKKACRDLLFPPGCGNLIKAVISDTCPTQRTQSIIQPNLSTPPQSKSIDLKPYGVTFGEGTQLHISTLEGSVPDLKKAKELTDSERAQTNAEMIASQARLSEQSHAQQRGR